MSWCYYRWPFYWHLRLRVVGGVKHKADYTGPFSTGTISFSEVECCERKTGVLGKQWLGSGIVENAQREEPFGCSLQLNSVAKMGLF